MDGKIDVIIASCGNDDKHINLTRQAVKTCIDSNPDLVEVTVIESCKNVVYPNCKTIYFPQGDNFNYHRTMNKGIESTKNKYIAICNNDLIFRDGWAKNILNAMDKLGYESASPVSERFHDIKRISNKAEEGYQMGYHICGWCLVFTRDMINRIVDKTPWLTVPQWLDETVTFYYSDNAYRAYLVHYNIKHILVWNSRVDHLDHGGATWRDITCKSKKRRLTDLQKNNFNKIVAKLQSI